MAIKRINRFVYLSCRSITRSVDRLRQSHVYRKAYFSYIILFFVRASHFFSGRRTRTIALNGRSTCFEHDQVKILNRRCSLCALQFVIARTRRPESLPTLITNVSVFKTSLSPRDTACVRH